LEFRNFLKALQEQEDKVNPIRTDESFPEVIELTEGESAKQLRESAVGEGVAILLESSLKHPMWAELEGVLHISGRPGLSCRR